MSDKLPYLNSEQLTALFGYMSVESFHESRRRGFLPIPVYKLSGKIVADVEVVKEFFLRMRDEGLEELDQIETREARKKIAHAQRAAHARKFVDYEKRATARWGPIGPDGKRIKPES